MSPSHLFRGLRSQEMGNLHPTKGRPHPKRANSSFPLALKHPNAHLRHLNAFAQPAVNYAKYPLECEGLSGLVPFVFPLTAHKGSIFKRVHAYLAPYLVLLAMKLGTNKLQGERLEMVGGSLCFFQFRRKGAT